MSRRVKRSAWEGPIPPEIMQCSDMFIVDRFKKLVREANEVLGMQGGHRKDEKIKSLNERLEDLVHQAKRKIDNGN